MSELSEKSIKLAEKDGWYLRADGLYHYGERIGNAYIDFSLTRKELILKYRNHVNKEGGE